MPAQTVDRQPSKRDSWPPTQMRLLPRIEQDDAEIEELDLSGIDEDPLNFFLTPAPLTDDDDDVDMMDFDAGIEDAKHPPPIVRSVSPSSLEGLSLPPPRPPTPPRSPSTPDLDMDMIPTPEDGEDYIHFAGRRSHTFPLQFTLKDFTRFKDKRGSITRNDPWLSAESYHGHIPSTRGRVPVRPGHRASGAMHGVAGQIRRPRSWSGRRSPHAWREPSPDVWSIEEETEEEVNSEMGDSMVEHGREARVVRAQAIDIPAAKPKKRVRFALPAIVV